MFKVVRIPKRVNSRYCERTISGFIELSHPERSEEFLNDDDVHGIFSFHSCFSYSSKQASAAAGGGDQRYVPDLCLALQYPCLSFSKPIISCPLMNQSLGCKNTISSGVHVFLQFF